MTDPQEAIDRGLHVYVGRSPMGGMAMRRPREVLPDGGVVTRDSDCEPVRSEATWTRAEWDKAVRRGGLWAKVGLWAFERADDPAVGTIRYCHAHPATAGRELHLRREDHGNECQRTVAAWRNETFGRGPWGKVLGRLVEELAELARMSGPDRAADALAEAADWLKAYGAEGEAPDGVGSELADVQVVLYGLADACGIPLAAATDAKMAINRGRRWRVDGPGLGHHE
jgi:hypothetical protein